MKTTTAFTKIANLKNRVRLIRGGTSASKTYSILQYLIIYAFNRKLTISIIGYTSRMLEKGCYKDFIRILKELEYYDASKHNLTNKTYQLNDSTFQFFTGEDSSKLRGIRSNICYINEANLISFESYSELSSRTKLFTICDWNPTAIFWADNYLVGNENVDFVTLTYKDNEFLDRKIIEEIESWEKLGETNKFFANKWLTMGLGQLGIQEGAIYTDYSIIDSLPKDAELLGSGLDFGFSVDPSALISVYRYDGEIIIDEVVYQKGLLNSQLSNLIKQSGVRSKIIYADSAEPKSIAELKSYGLNVLPVNKGKDSINYGIQLLQQKHFKVTARSKNLIKELQNYTWTKDKEGKSLSVPIDNWNHALDALRYFFLMKFGNKGGYFSLSWKQ